MEVLSARDKSRKQTQLYRNPSQGQKYTVAIEGLCLTSININCFHFTINVFACLIFCMNLFLVVVIFFVFFVREKCKDERYFIVRVRVYCTRPWGNRSC